MLTKEYLISKGFEEVLIKRYHWKEEELAMKKYYFVIFPRNDNFWEFEWKGGYVIIKTKEYLKKLYEVLMNDIL